MKWRTNKGASLGFTITTALLAAIIICALFVSCGRTHSGAAGTSSAVGSGLAPTGPGVGAPLAAPRQGRASTAPTIPLSVVLAQIDAYPAPKNVDASRFATLKAELKRLLIARASGAKSISIAPTGTMNAVTDLTAVSNPAGTQATLTWTEVLPGDYDNDGAVDIADIIPVALYYGQRTDSGPDDAHRLVNGDLNPEINIWDLGAIAANYGAHLQGYQVWRGHWNGTSTDWETAFRPNTNPANADWSADRPSPPPVSRRPAYNYVDDITAVADKANVRYKVTAYGDGAPGQESNEATMPPPTYFSISGAVTTGSPAVGLAGVTLTLTPGGLNAATQADGSYTFTGLLNGSYTLSPSLTGYSFMPPVRQVTVAGADVTAQDFSAVAWPAEAPWPKFHGNAQSTGLSPYIGSQTGNVKWTYPTGNALTSSPAIGADGTVYVGSYDYKVYALSPADGSAKWSYTTGSSVYSSPAIGADGTVYVGSYYTPQANVYALNPADGSVKWTYLTGSGVYSSPAVGADGTVYVGSWDKSIYALNPADGSVKWTYKTEGEVYSSPAIGADGTVYVGSYDFKLYAFGP